MDRRTKGVVRTACGEQEPEASATRLGLPPARQEDGLPLFDCLLSSLALASLLTEPLSPTEALETSGRAQWLGQETGHNAAADSLNANSPHVHLFSIVLLFRRDQDTLLDGPCCAWHTASVSLSREQPNHERGQNQAANNLKTRVESRLLQRKPPT